MLSSQNARFLPASDRSLLIQFGDRIELKSHALVAPLLQILEAEPVAGVQNFHPAYSSLLVTFDPLRLTHAALEETLRQHINLLKGLAFPDSRLVEVPVSYGGDLGPDLVDLAVLRGIPPEDVCSLHAATEYTVYFLGFVPGFAYLGELPDALVTPRLATPRRSVPPGSVGIAGKQTGVYPLPTPGGWRLIGRTPLPMFDPETGSRLRIGDRVRFVPISAEQYAALEKEQAKA